MSDIQVVEDLAPQFTYNQEQDVPMIEAENRKRRVKTGSDFRGNPKYDISLNQRNRYNQLKDVEETGSMFKGALAFKQSPEGIEQDRRLAEQRQLEEAFFQDELQSMIDAEIRRIAERELDIETRARTIVPPPEPDLGDGGGGKGEEEEVFDDPVMRSDMDALIFDPVKNEYRSVGTGRPTRPGQVERAFASDYGLSGIRDIMNLQQREKGKPYVIPDEEGRKVSATMLNELLRLEGLNTAGKTKEKINERAQKIFGTQLPEGVGATTREANETLLFGRQVGSDEATRESRTGKGVRLIRFNKKFYNDFYKKLNNYHQKNK